MGRGDSFLARRRSGPSLHSHTFCLTWFVKMNERTDNPVNTDPQGRMKTQYLSMWMDNGFLCCRYATDLHLSLDVAKACVEARIFFARGLAYPLLIDMKGIKSTTREARLYMASVGATLVKGAALITGSAVNRTIGNIFLKIDRPPVPLKLFTSEEKARHWLSQFLEQPVQAV